ncbi:MAG: beta-lactamase family protein [Rhodomicrobium sp.]|nr:beta-lactamase family protein [Rhodomicrobium sp.]
MILLRRLAAASLIAAVVFFAVDQIGWRAIALPPPATPGFADVRFSAANEAATRLLVQHRKQIDAPALSAAVAVNGAIIWSAAIGWADIENERAATPDTIFRIGSTSKALTATLTGRLLDQGIVALDTPISEYSGQLPEHWRSLTLRQLHSHTAGMVGYENNSDILGLIDSFLLWRRYDNVRDALSQFDDASLTSEPGSTYAYSSFDVVLASFILEQAAGRPFLEVMRDNVFDPAGLASTGADHDLASQPDYAISYVTRNGRAKPWRRVDLSSKLASGGFSSTSTDLVRLGVEYLHGDLLSRDAVHLLWTPQRLSTGEINEESYAVGWRSQLAYAEWLQKDVWIVHHGGISKGAMSWLAIYPELDIVIALNMNARAESFRDFNSLSVKLAELFYRSAAHK